MNELPYSILQFWDHSHRDLPANMIWVRGWKFSYFRKPKKFDCFNVDAFCNHYKTKLKAKASVHFDEEYRLCTVEKQQNHWKILSSRLNWKNWIRMYKIDQRRPLFWFFFSLVFKIQLISIQGILNGFHFSKITSLDNIILQRFWNWINCWILSTKNVT